MLGLPRDSSWKPADIDDVFRVLTAEMRFFEEKWVAKFFSPFSMQQRQEVEWDVSGILQGSLSDADARTSVYTHLFRMIEFY